MIGPIVFIDDEPMLCRAFSLALRPLGHPVITFTDPLLAVDYVNAAGPAPCVVICDYRMPGLTGLEVLERLPAAVPFVLVSGDLFAVEAIGERRISAFLAKPIQPDTLLEVVGPFVVPRA